MGVQQVDVAAEQVIIRCADKDIIIENPQVARVTMMGQQTFQVSGAMREERRAPLVYIPDQSDIDTVISQTKVSVEQARVALVNSGGDIAEAILALQE